MFRQRETSESVRRFLDARIGLTEIVITAVLLAVGTNLLASAIAEYVSPIAVAVLGIAFSFAGLGYVWNKRFPKVDARRSLAFIATDYLKRELVPMGDYPLAFWVSRSLEAAMIESPDLRPELSRAASSIERDRETCEILREAAEFYVVFELMGAIWDAYAERNTNADGRIRHRVRDFFGELLSNRVLNLISAPTQGRSSMGHQSVDGSTLVVHPDGALFLGLEARMPDEATVTRPSPSTIRLTLRTLVLDIDTSIVRDEGVSSRFETLYLKREPFSTLFIGVSFSTSLTLRSRLPFLGRLSRDSAAWREYLWVTEYVESLHDAVSWPSFLEYLGWEAVPAIAHVLGDSGTAA